MNYVNLSYYQFRYVRYMSDICRYVRYLSDICRYLSDIGHIGNLGSFTKAILLQKCSISLISPDIAIRSRSSRSDWLHRFTSYGRTNMKNLRPPTQKAPSGQICCGQNSKIDLLTVVNLCRKNPGDDHPPIPMLEFMR